MDDCKSLPRRCINAEWNEQTLYQLRVSGSATRVTSVAEIFEEEALRRADERAAWSGVSSASQRSQSAQTFGFDTLARIMFPPQHRHIFIDIP